MQTIITVMASKDDTGGLSLSPSPVPDAVSNGQRSDEGGLAETLAGNSNGGIGAEEDDADLFGDEEDGDAQGKSAPCRSVLPLPVSRC